jgi:hypothetical protein
MQTPADNLTTQTKIFIMGMILGAAYGVLFAVFQIMGERDAVNR